MNGANETATTKGFAKVATGDETIAVRIIDSDSEIWTGTLADMIGENDLGLVNEEADWVRAALPGDSRRFFGFVGTYYDIARLAGV
jgi:hypothetical protein